MFIKLFLSFKGYLFEAYLFGTFNRSFTVLLVFSSLQYVSNKIKPRQWISFTICVFFYWIHTVVYFVISNKPCPVLLFDRFNILLENEVEGHLRERKEHENFVVFFNPFTAKDEYLRSLGHIWRRYRAFVRKRIKFATKWYTKLCN